jgi:predicted MPP superfamily phosphohydrolase
VDIIPRERALLRAPLDEEREAWAAARERIERSRHWVSPKGRRLRRRTEAFNVALWAFATSVKFAGLFGRGRRNALAPTLVDLDLFFPTLPTAFDGYRILHLTDTHLDALPELADIAERMLVGVEADLLVLTGDIMGKPDGELVSATVPLARVLAGTTIRDRRLAVLGNHDPTTMAGALETLGFEVLLNRAVTLVRGTDRISITGLDDVHQFYTEAAGHALFESGEEFRIALVHSPEMADHAAEAGIALYLTGHTHGGQICLPGGRPLLTRLTRCRHAAVGQWRHGMMQGYTSRGLGISWPPLRYNCRGEITMITLRRAL